jgi:acetylornithine deacetylase/succinyl-diaminopimelate desuccinylase-like protein
MQGTAKIDRMLEQVLATAATNVERDLANLIDLVRQPSISAQGIGVRECAELVRGQLEAAGLATRLLETPVYPMVYGERLNAHGMPTLLIYGHYDVQPPEPLDAWISPPFEPEIRDGALYGRGTGDNKGQFFANLCGVRAWIDAIGELPINVKFLVEGEEETGSPHIAGVVEEHRDLLAADLIYTSDGPVQDDDHPQIDYGVRGVLNIELRVHGTNQDLHSGNWGGVAPNAAWLLVQLLATMMDRENRVTVEGFYDEAAPIDETARAAMERIPIDQQAALTGIGIAELPPPTGVGYLERLMFQPTMTINGLASGYQGEGSKTVIPSEAVAKLDMRLVPDQRAADIYEKIVRHVERHADNVEVIHHGAMEASFTPLDHPLAGAVRRAVERGFGKRPVDIPLIGASLPDAVWTRTLGIPSFLVPLAQSDERNHAPNEHFEIARFQAGIRTAAALIAELANAEVAE